MSTSPAVQEARKEMQLKRLEAKGRKGYTTYYANQPFQLEEARRNKERQGMRKVLKDATEALEVAEITGVGLAAAKERHAIAALVVERAKPQRGGNTSSLSGA